MLAGLFFLISPCRLAAQGETFGVDSYIPERFTDTEWRIYGGLYLNGSDDDGVSTTNPLSRYVLESFNNDQDDLRMNMGYFFRYRYETVPKYLDAEMSLEGRLNYRDATQSSQRIDTIDQTYSSESTYDQNYHTINVYPRIDAGMYVSGDFFLSLIGFAGTSYSEYPADDHTYRSTSITEDGIDYIYTYFSESAYNNTADIKNYSFGLEILPGVGRVYEGKFASTAMYIIDELRSNRILAREPTAGQMQALSEIIYLDLMRHSVDYRIYRIEAVQAIMDYLISEGILIDSNPYVHLVVQDVWTYFPRDSRRFGLRARAGFGFAYDYESSQVTNLADHYSLNTRHHEDTPDVLDTIYLSTGSFHHYRYDKTAMSYPYIRGEADYYKPLNHRWHFNVSAGGSYYLGAKSKRQWDNIDYALSAPFTPDTVAKAREDIDFSNFYEFDCQVLLNYIFSSRTQGIFTITAGYSGVDQEITENVTVGSVSTAEVYEGPSCSDWQYSARMSIIYRISIPTTISLSARYFAGDNVKSLFGRYDERDNKGYNLNIDLTHYVF